jgi:hypothetical protein
VNPRPSSGSRSPRKIISALRLSSPMSRMRSETDDNSLPASPRNRNMLMKMFHIDPDNELQRKCLAPLEAVLREERTSEEIAQDPDLYSQLRMLRFLRGLKFQNVEECAKCFRAMLVWRKVAGVDQVSETILCCSRDFIHSEQLTLARVRGIATS